MAPRPSSIALLVLAAVLALLSFSHAAPPARLGNLTVPKAWIRSGIIYRPPKTAGGKPGQPIKLYLIGFSFVNGTNGTCALPNPSANATTTNISADNLFNNCLVTKWIAKVKGKNYTFDWAVTGLTSTGGRKLLAECPVLVLDLGRLNLDLLGLEINLAPVSLDIIANSGPGRLLGNLLCAVVGLLDGGGLLGGLTGLLSGLTDALQNLLGGLLGGGLLG